MPAAILHQLGTFDTSCLEDNVHTPQGIGLHHDPRVEPELIEDLCTPQLNATKKLKYKTLSQRNVFRRPGGSISAPDTFDVLRR